MKYLRDVTESQLIQILGAGTFFHLAVSTCDWVRPSGLTRGLPQRSPLLAEQRRRAEARFDAYRGAPRPELRKRTEYSDTNRFSRVPAPRQILHSRVAGGQTRRWATKRMVL